MSCVPCVDLRSEARTPQTAWRGGVSQWMKTRRNAAGLWLHFSIGQIWLVLAAILFRKIKKHFLRVKVGCLHGLVLLWEMSGRQSNMMYGLQCNGMSVKRCRIYIYTYAYPPVPIHIYIHIAVLIRLLRLYSYIYICMYACNIIYTYIHIISVMLICWGLSYLEGTPVRCPWAF